MTCDVAALRDLITQFLIVFFLQRQYIETLASTANAIFVLKGKLQ